MAPLKDLTQLSKYAWVGLVGVSAAINHVPLSIEHKV
jgi:hypothetical protein